MEDIDRILENHSSLARPINKLKSSTRLCLSSVSSDMFKAKVELDWLDSHKHVSFEEFVAINSFLKELGKEFDKCRCLSRDEKP